MGSNTQVFIKRYGNNVCLSTSESALYLDDMHSMQQVFVTRCVVPSFMWDSNVVGAKPALPKRYAPLDDTPIYELTCEELAFSLLPTKLPSVKQKRVIARVRRQQPYLVEQ